MKDKKVKIVIEKEKTIEVSLATDEDIDVELGNLGYRRVRDEVFCGSIARMREAERKLDAVKDILAELDVDEKEVDHQITMHEPADYLKYLAKRVREMIEVAEVFCKDDEIPG